MKFVHSEAMTRQFVRIAMYWQYNSIAMQRVTQKCIFVAETLVSSEVRNICRK